MSSSNTSKQWVAVCPSDLLGVEEVRACSVEGRQLAVWRDGESGVHVWDDRCPHRGLPLSEGSVSGGLLTCPAHGWRLDINGQAVRPITASVPARQAACATVHAAREEGGTISACFARTGEAERAQ